LADYSGEKILLLILRSQHLEQNIKLRFPDTGKGTFKYYITFWGEMGCKKGSSDELVCYFEL